VDQGVELLKVQKKKAIFALYRMQRSRPPVRQAGKDLVTICCDSTKNEEIKHRECFIRITIIA